MPHPGSHHLHQEEVAGHGHPPVDYNRIFALGIVLNVGFVVVEAVFGFVLGSLALLADAGHNLSDVLGLLLAWGGHLLAQRPPTNRYTYGLRRSSILAALINGVVLLVVMGAIAWESIQRLGEPIAVPGGLLITVASVGILINGVTAWLFVKDRSSDLNLRGAFLHMAADTLVSIGVVLVGAGILLTGWSWLDPVISLIIVIVVIVSTWQLLTKTLALALDAVPATIDPQAVKQYLNERPGVRQVHDLHIWAMSTTEIAMTAHLVMPGGHPGDRFLAEVDSSLREHFGIHHTTLQIELCDTDDLYRLEADRQV